eukprot:scaffold12741_cov171-Isochrysis_galbana.AAC.1
MDSTSISPTPRLSFAAARSCCSTARHQASLSPPRYTAARAVSCESTVLPPSTASSHPPAAPACSHPPGPPAPSHPPAALSGSVPPRPAVSCFVTASDQPALTSSCCKATRTAAIRARPPAAASRRLASSAQASSCPRNASSRPPTRTPNPTSRRSSAAPPAACEPHGVRGHRTERRPPPEHSKQQAAPSPTPPPVGFGTGRVPGRVRKRQPPVALQLEHGRRVTVRRGRAAACEEHGALHTLPAGNNLLQLGGRRQFCFDGGRRRVYFGGGRRQFCCGGGQGRWGDGCADAGWSGCLLWRLSLRNCRTVVPRPPRPILRHVATAALRPLGYIDAAPARARPTPRCRPDAPARLPPRYPHDAGHPRAPPPHTKCLAHTHRRRHRHPVRGSNRLHLGWGQVAARLVVSYGQKNQRRRGVPLHPRRPRPVAPLEQGRPAATEPLQAQASVVPRDSGGEGGRASLGAGRAILGAGAGGETLCIRTECPAQTGGGMGGGLVGGSMVGGGGGGGVYGCAVLGGGAVV